MSRPARRVLYPAVMAVLVISAGASSAEVAVTGTSTEAITAEFTDAELSDLRQMAAEDGISLEQAIHSFGWQNDFALFASQVENDHPEHFSYARIDSAGGQRASIHFKSEVPLEVAILSAREEVDLAISLHPGTGYSSAEIAQRVEDVHRAASASGLASGVVTTYDYDLQTVIVEFAPSGEPSVEAGDVIERMQDAVAQEVDHAGVIFTVDQKLSAGVDAINGGGRFEFVGSESLACSAAFNVVKAGVRGVGTAGHCNTNSSVTIENTGTGVEYSTTYQDEHVGGWGDFEWRTTPTTETDDFQAEYHETRDVSAISSPVMDQRLCRFGFASGRNCSAYTQDLSACYDPPDFPEICRVVRMDRDTASGGDSGGPWYFGNTAYGIHSGYIGTWLGDRDVWSRVMYIDEALGVNILNY